MRIRKNRVSSSSSSSGSRSGRRRLRKKQKRLDAICEAEYTRNRVHEAEANGGAGSDAVRRSSRLRKAPEILDVSPRPGKRRRRTEGGGRSEGKKTEEESGGGVGGWKLRLRSTVHSGDLGLGEKFIASNGKRKLFDDEIDDNIGVVEVQKSRRGKSKRDGRRIDKGSGSPKIGDQTDGPSDSNLEGGMVVGDREESKLPEKVVGEKCGIDVDGNLTQLVEMEELHVDDESSRSGHLEKTDQGDKQVDPVEGEKVREDCMVEPESVRHDSDKLDNGASCMAKESTSPDVVGETLDDRNVGGDKLKRFSTDVLDKHHIGAGRRCGLCGRGTDGKPPKRLVTDHTDSDKETYGGSSSCEEGNYDILDGFGDEPGWLGRLLGPIHDRFGIADVWVHQHCAVWSPEVYFAGLGCLKNVRAALSRGKALKCSRCGRPGATIGCRVDRCPKTYHLPCGRVGGCIFDHRKFLIACNDHRHLFEPYRNNSLQRLKKLKARKLKLVTRKLSHDAWKKDFEAEEKWLENCGEDEEFLKREGKRLHRDILRIAPVYIGGPSTESEKLYCGWESVAGLQDVIRSLKEVVILPLLYPDFFTKIGLTPPRGVLLHGYPGTGKTHIVRALIGSCARGDRRIAYFARKGADCLGKYVGDAERQLRLLFQIAEKSQPSIIFFDEIDGLAPCRTRQQDQTHNSVVSTLLALMDGLKSRGSVIVIGATNRPDAVDPALRRPGRFDREIYFPLPSVKDRAAILSLHTQNWPKPISGSLLKWIAQKTPGFAGADLQALCTQAAMIALRRNCPLQELMCAAEMKANNGGRLPLPTCLVEEMDWLDALGCAPPPCSRRDAGMTANEVVSSPLHAHFFPCLLQPLSYLLVSLYLDERVWLPPFLYKAANLIKTVITSTLNQREKPSDHWWSYLPDLVKEADIARRIEKTLSCAGFLISGPDFGNYSALSGDNDDDVGTEYEFCKVSSAGAGAGASLLQNVSCSGRRAGFRVLITGNPKSGQIHLAACLLHGFVGCVEIQKVDLATISQEGHGDMVEGMTNILLKCSSKGVYIIYMPRIDLWAIETQYEEVEMEADANMCESADTSGPCDASKTASRLWNSFMEQVDSICPSTSLMILATSEVRSEDIPDRISQFFTSNVMRSSNIVGSEHTMPRFIVHVGGSFDYDMVIDSSATQLSKDIIQEYIQLLHHRIHAALTPNQNKVSDAILDDTGLQNHNTLNRIAAEGTNVTNSIRKTSEGVGFLDSNETEQHPHDQCPTMLPTTDHKKYENRLCDNSIPRFLCGNKTVKGKSSLLLAISSFGYQILRYPHFAELCWTTSKLKEGPFADINGPWKGWPFHSCIVRPDNSSEKVSLGRSSNSGLGSKEYFGVVRGLIAVGLLAYKGVYTSIKQVSLDVRKVLELVVAQINFKILAGKDKSRFHYLLSQVSYLEDMVNSWSYTLKSLECNSTSTVSSGSMTVQCPNVHHTSELNATESDVCKDNIPQKSSDEVIVLEQTEFIDPNEGKENTRLDLPNSEATATNSEQPLHEMASDKFVEIRHETSGVSRTSNGLTNCKSKLISEGGISSHDESNGMNSSCRKVRKGCKGVSAEMMFPKTIDSAHDSDEALENVNNSLKENIGMSVSSVSRFTCLYSCCFNCINSVYGLIRKILIREWKTVGSSLTVEEAHDAICSWSTNFLSSVRKFYAAENFRKSELICKNLTHETDKRFCSCSVDHRQTNGNTHHTSSENSEVEPVECSFHSKSKDITENTDACLDSEVGLRLKFSFKDNVLISSDLDKDVLFHCKFQNLCLSSLIESILMIKQPLN